MVIELEETTDPPGLEVYDSIEQRHLHVRTSRPVAPEPTDSDGFCYPVDAACTIETESIVFDQRYFVNLRDGEGEWNKKIETGETIPLERDVQFLELSGPIKLYCRITDPGRIEIGIDSIHLVFEDESEITIGARSLHEKPAGTIRTPDEPEAMMEAVSTLSSALKTTSPERTWPTLRGYPPLIERGDDLEIPSGLTRPETDVTLEVPVTYRNLYTVAPLAFYLGAEIRPGAEPTLSTPVFEHTLGDEGRFEDEVATLLKQSFFLDCLARTEGLYENDLYERQRLDGKLPFDLATVYDLALPDRLARYLEVPYDHIEPYVPRWPLTAHVPADPETVELLPFIVNELGIIREPRGETVTAPTGTPSGQAGLARSTTLDREPVDAPPKRDRQFVVPEVNDESLEHAWFGDHVPQTASKATIEAYRSQLSRDARSQSIEILLVCNDVRMLEEHDLLDDVYGNRELLPFDVTSEFGVSSDDLARLLTEGGFDFLHYIGHATPEGLECPNGKLDVRTLEEVDLDVFFLNACSSYDQGLALVRRGAFGGVSTLRDVDNEHAVEIGKTMARLLNLGFPLRAALEIARENSLRMADYLIVGDGSADLAQTEGGAPVLVKLDRESGTQFTFSICSYPTKEYKLGSATASNIAAVEDRHLTSGNTPATCVPETSLQNYLTWTNPPMVVDGEIRWTDGVGPFTIN